MLTGLCLLLTGLVSQLDPASPWQLSLGASGLLYLGPLSGAVSMATDVAIEGPVSGPMRFAAGARLGTSPVAPEAFVRGLYYNDFEVWRPRGGIELGVSGRSAYEHNTGVLHELRAAAHSELDPMYLAFYAAPLQFAFGKVVRLSVLELSVGTHLTPLGRYARVQVGFLYLGVSL